MSNKVVVDKRLIKDYIAVLHARLEKDKAKLKEYEVDPWKFAKERALETKRFVEMVRKDDFLLACHQTEKGYKIKPFPHMVMREVLEFLGFDIFNIELSRYPFDMTATANTPPETFYSLAESYVESFPSAFVGFKVRRIQDLERSIADRERIIDDYVMQVELDEEEYLMMKRAIETNAE